jgi:hypothetical protein
MSKQNKIARLTAGPSPRKKAARGRTGDVDPSAKVHAEENNAKGKMKLEKMVDVNRAEGKASKRGGANRGDRRDTNKTYTGNARHAARGNTPRVDVSTRKR